MRDELIIIDSILNEHAAMGGHMESICLLLDSWDAEEFSELEKSEREWSINQKGLNMKETMLDLDEGIKQHHRHEEEILLPIAGEPILEALKVEHREMEKQIGEINFVLRDFNPDSLLSNMDYLKLIVSNLCNLINSHSLMENNLLNLLKKRFI